MNIKEKIYSSIKDKWSAIKYSVSGRKYISLDDLIRTKIVEGVDADIKLPENEKKLQDLYDSHYLDMFPWGVRIEKVISSDMIYQVHRDHNLYAAIKNENVESVKEAINQGANVNFSSVIVSEFINEAAETGNLEIVKILVENGADLKNEFLLSKAVMGKNAEIVEYLVEKGVDVNDDNGQALSTAIIRNDYEMVELLIELKADVISDSGSVLADAVCFTNVDVIKLLVEHGADIHETKDELLVSGAFRGSLDIVKYLIEHGANPNAVVEDEDWKSKACGVSYAARFDRLEIVQYLVEHGADIQDTFERGSDRVKEWANKYVNTQKMATKLTDELNMKSTDKSKAQELLTGIHALGIKQKSQPAMRAKI